MVKYSVLLTYTNLIAVTQIFIQNIQQQQQPVTQMLQQEGRCGLLAY